MVETVRGTVNGTVIVAVAKGAIIGATYVVAGVPSPLIFALPTVAFAMVPFGAWIVLTSAALLLAFQGGSAFAATAVFFFGAAVVSFALVPLSEGFAWVSVTVGGVYLLLALGSWLDARSHRRF